MKKIKQYMLENGASLVGFANLSSVEGCKWKSGISIAIAIDIEVLKSIENGPTMAYYNEYYRLNDKLDELSLLAEEYIKKLGYEAVAQTRERTEEFGIYRTEIPHKTVATQAGLGWIGKSAMLVTKEYGPAVRIGSILTDYELDYDKPYMDSECGACMNCSLNCPGNAISGENWSIMKDRDEFFSPVNCRKEARRLSAERLNKAITLCGKCIVVCPYTRKLLSREE